VPPKSYGQRAMVPKTEGTLAGRLIWVTRPRQQAEPLCQLIESAGGTAVRLPVIEIQPLPETQGQGVIGAGLEKLDLVIFISRNAVNHAATVLPDFYNRIAGKPLLAVGAGTQDELALLGRADAIYAATGVGSEALLQMEPLRLETLAGKRILIVRGVGGRELLEQTLRVAGAELLILEVYQRSIPGVNAGAMADLWRNYPPDAIIITSVEGLQNLVQMTASDQKALLLRTPLVIMSDRISATARKLGFSHTPAVSASASDTGLLQATISLFS